MNALKIALAVFLLNVLLTGNAAAFGFSASDAATICADTIGSSSIFGARVTSQQSMLAIAMLIMLVMLLVSAMAYMIGYAFGITPLLRFSRNEMREVAITALVVLVFLGSFSIASGSAGLSGFATRFSGMTPQNVFTADCASLSNSAINMVGYWLTLSVSQLLLSSLSGMFIIIRPGGFGSRITPLAGLSTLTANSGVLGLLTNFTGIFIVMLFVMSIVLGVFYTLFPLFFYTGIVLRTLPWTRAAGGAFLGLFISFYFMFPFLLYMFISPYSQSAVQQTAPSLAALSNIPNIFSSSNPLNAVGSLVSTLSNLSLITLFITGIVEPVIFLLIAILFSLLISLDFMEALGDLLGSPDLSSRHALRGLI